MNVIFRTFSSLYLSVHDEEKCKMQICNGQLAKHIYHPMSSRVNSTKIMRNDVFVCASKMKPTNVNYAVVRCGNPSAHFRN